MSHGDGGKGSGRRKEDASKVRDNWDLIFGKKKGQQTMNDDYEHIEDDEDEFDDMCDWCSGTGEGQYDGSSCRKCNGTGMMPFDGEDNNDDYV